MSSPRYTHQKLLSLVIALTLAVSFVMPAWAQEATVDDSSANVSDDQGIVDASQADIEIAQQSSGCQPILTIDTNGNVSGQGGIGGWFGDASTPFDFGAGVVDVYRGDTFISTTATGASRGVQNVRQDVDTALGITDGRSGFFVPIDWTKEPAGSQTYRVLGRTRCEWTEARVTLNVNPAPPAPSASLTINDVTRDVSSNVGVGYNYGGIYGGSTVCTQYNSLGQCVGYGTTSSNIYGGGCNYIGGICYPTTNTNYNTTNDVNMDFTVTLSPASTQTVQVDWTTADGSGVSSSDYQSGSGTLTFNPGDTTKTITIRAYGRTNDATDRTFYVRLSNPRNAGISDGEGIGRINRTGSSCGSIVNGLCTNTGLGINNCTSFINGICQSYGTGYYGVGGVGGVSVSDATCNEGAVCVFTLTAPGFATVTYQTQNGTALGGTGCTGGVGSPDYVTVATTTSFTTTTSVSVTTCVDATVEGAETFQLVVTSSSVGVARNGTATIAANGT